MKIKEVMVPPPLRTMGKIRAGFPSTGSPEMDDSMDGTDVKKEQDRYTNSKKNLLKKHT